jgi:cysteine synthase A
LPAIPEAYRLVLQVFIKRDKCVYLFNALPILKEPSPHPLQGIGAGFIPSNLDTEVLDGVIQVGKDESFEYAKRAASEEGIFQGISSGATMAATAKKIPEMAKGSRVLIFNYDTGERYFSIEGLF